MSAVMIMMIASASVGIIWSLPTLLLAVFGISLNRLTGAKATSFLSKNVAYSSIRTNDDPSGWICGRWFVGYVYESDGQQGAPKKDLFVLTTNRCFKRLTVGVAEIGIDGSEKKKIDFLEREGLFWHLSYPSRAIDPPTNIPWGEQKRAIANIIQDFTHTGYSTVLLVGEPGSGKSMIPLQICRELLETCDKVTLVDTWNPTEPGDFFGAIYNKVNPTVKKPLVVVLEEVDGMIGQMHRNEIKINTSTPMPIQIKTKTDWNQFLDRFDRKMYQGVVLCLTSNKPLSWFDSLDSSYTRAGRVNLRCEISKHQHHQTTKIEIQTWS
jgi:hypothetical protein